MGLLSLLKKFTAFLMLLMAGVLGIASLALSRFCSGWSASLCQVVPFVSMGPMAFFAFSLILMAFAILMYLL